MSERVTIGVCVKNSERTIRQSIKSIISQNYPMELIQLIVVDGLSKDKTLSIINSETSKTCMIVETYFDKGEGLGTARQIVVNNAKGKYIIFVDGDVRLTNDFVRNHVNFMEKNPDFCVAFGTPLLQEGTLIATVWDLSRYVVGGFAGNDATIYRSEVLRQIGGFDSHIKGAGEDMDLMRRIRAKGWLISSNEKARYFHNHRANLRSFWDEQSWMGYGDHYVHHKHNSINTVWRNMPAGALVYGLKLASRAYQRTHRKISFLIPSQLIWGNISWWFGFIKAHVDGYGHGKNS
jgi:glycosyltransferase involved in cell wall biosynthesis